LNDPMALSSSFLKRRNTTYVYIYICYTQQYNGELDITTFSLSGFLFPIVVHLSAALISFRLYRLLCRLYPKKVNLYEEEKTSVFDSKENFYFKNPEIIRKCFFIRKIHEKSIIN